MRYTTLGKTNLRVSRLGFGCMRLPMTEAGAVDRDLSIPMLQHAVERGVNYFDTAIGYCNGDSQRVLGEAMAGRRDKVILSTKNHMHEAPEDAWWGRLDESLRLLQTDYIDVYNLHGMTWKTWVQHIDTPTGKYRLLEKARDQGMIRHICSSFHDTPEALVRLAETGMIESMTVQYNLLSRDLEAAIYRLKELGLGVVVMGPVGGGRLGVDSERVRELTRRRVESVPEAALRFVLAHPGVDVALSGMNTMDMLEANVRTIEDKEPFTPDQVSELDTEVERVRKRRGVTCTACGYCLPCPNGVNIPGNFGIYNQYTIYGLLQSAETAYARQSGRAVLCSECGACLPKCPQKIDIPGVLRKVITELDRDFDQWGVIFTVTGFEGDSVRARVALKNLSDRPRATSVSLDLGSGVTCEPTELSFGPLAAGETTSKSLSIRTPDGVGIIEGQVLGRSGDEVRRAAVHIPFLVIPRDRMRRHNVVLRADDFGGREDIAASHGYNLGLWHDDKSVHVDLSIRSELHGLARPGESSGARMELYVDMRPEDAGFGQPPYGEGVEQLFLSLGEPGYGSQSQKSYRLDLRHERTADGVRIRFALPFSDFLQPDWPRPTRIGFDVMFVACDPDGRELGHPTFGGKGALYKNPAAFAPAVLI